MIIYAAVIVLALALTSCSDEISADKAYCERIGDRGAKIIDAARKKTILIMPENDHNGKRHTSIQRGGQMINGTAYDAATMPGEKLAGSSINAGGFELYPFDKKCVVLTSRNENGKEVAEKTTYTLDLR